MATTFDLIIIGTGTAAATAANRCANAGWRVAVVDHLPYGGTCALRGCDPKKVLVGVAEAFFTACDQQCQRIGHDEANQSGG